MRASVSTPTDVQVVLWVDRWVAGWVCDLHKVACGMGGWRHGLMGGLRNGWMGGFCITFLGLITFLGRFDTYKGGLQVESIHGKR